MNHKKQSRVQIIWSANHIISYGVKRDFFFKNKQKLLNNDVITSPEVNIA